MLSTQCTLTREGLMKAALENVLGPEVVQWLGMLYWALIAPLFSEPRFNVVFMVSTLVVALVFYAVVVRRMQGAAGVWAYLFPQAVFGHPSARLDYKFFITNQLLMAHLRFGAVVVWLFGLLALSQNMVAMLNAVWGEHAAQRAWGKAMAKLGEVVIDGCIGL